MYSDLIDNVTDKYICYENRKKVGDKYSLRTRT